MIELIIGGVRIALPPNTTINREFETTIFNREASVSDFTLPIDVPITDETAVALGMPHLLANPIVGKSWTADLLVDGIFLNKVTFKTLRVRVKERILSGTIIGNYGSYGQVVGLKKVSDLLLGGIRNIGTLQSEITLCTIGYSGHICNIKYKPCNSHLYLANTISNPDAYDFAFLTTTDESTDLLFIHDEYNPINASYNIINGYDYENGEYIDPVRHYIKNIVDYYTGAANYRSGERHFWVPYFKLGYVLKKCFEEFGFAVSGDVFNDKMFMRILMHNTFAINNVTYNWEVVSAALYNMHVSHNGTNIDPRNHVPKVLITEWIAEVAKTFNLQYNVDYNTKTVVVKRLNNINQGSYIDLSNYAFNTPEVSFEKADFQNGYEFSFADNGGDAATNESVVNDSPYPVFDFVGRFADLASLPGPTVNALYLVRNTNSLYQYDGANFNFYGYNLANYKTSTDPNLQKIETKVAPMPMKFIDYSVQRVITGTPTKVDFNGEVCACYSNMGIEGSGLLGIDILKAEYHISLSNISKIYELFKSVNKIRPTSSLKILNNLGFQETLTTSHTYPHGGSGPYSAKGWLLNFTIAGSVYQPYSLFWRNIEGFGLVPEQWDAFLTILKNSVQVDWKIVMDILTYTGTDFNGNIFRIQGLNYLCKKASVTLPLPSESLLTMVRI
jgi:hypothetical protein